MPTPAFIAAASAANRKPVAFLAIESNSAIKASITTKNEWLNSSVMNYVNPYTEEGRVFLTTDSWEPYSGPYIMPVINYYFYCYAFAGYVAAVNGVVTTNIETAPVLSAGSRLIGITLGCDVLCEQSSSSAGSIRYRGNPIVDLYGQKDGGAWTLLQSQKVDGSRADFGKAYGGLWTTAMFTVSVDSGAWNFKFKMPRVEDVYSTGQVVSVGQLKSFALDISSQQRTLLTSYVSTGQIQTTHVDLGLVPSVASRLEVDDLVDVGCSINYVAYGSNDLYSWTNLGAVADGSSLSPFRYYYFVVTFNSNGVNTPFLDEIRVVGGDSQYEYLSTKKDTPIQGCKPYIAPGGISSISTKIDLTRPSTVGELTIKLFWTKEVGNMIATGYLKNKTIICKIGFEGLSEKDYEPYFVGTWYDFQADHKNRIITVKTRNILKKFNRKIPEAQYFLDTSGKTYVPPKTYKLSGNIMLVMLAIADLLGIPDRYIDRASFTNLAAGARSGGNWDVVRYLTEPMDARDLLNELSVSAGVFIVEGADGKQTAILCDDIDTSVPVATLDAMYHEFRQIDGGQKELFTRQTIYYQLLPGKAGSSASDFGKGLVYVNAQAEVDWQESATKEWMDKWGLSTTAIQKLAQRWDAWFSTPLSDVKVENVPPRFWNIKTGQIVAVDNLQFPCPSSEWQGYTSGTRFLVMSKTTSDPTSGNLSMSFDLKQLGVASFVPDADFPSYTPFDYFPLVRNVVLSERLVRLPGGSVDTILDIDFDRPLDFHYGSAAIWYRPAGRSWWAYKGQTDLGGPEDARVFSFSVSDGLTVEVAILTINAAGQTMSIDNAPKASKFIIGKTAPPATITDFYFTPVITGGIRFAWSAVPDVDVFEYSIRYSPLTSGASWDGASLLIRTAALYANLNTALNGTYFIKAIDTTGNASAAADSVLVTNVTRQIALTNHAVITAQPSWAGTTSNFTGGTELQVAWTDAPPDPELPPMTEMTGVYNLADDVDFGEVRTARVSAMCDWIALAPAFDDVESIDDMRSWDGATGDSNVQIYILTSQDSSDPTARQPLFAGDYTFQRASFELRAYRKLPDSVTVKTLVISIDLHDTVITI